MKTLSLLTAALLTCLLAATPTLADALPSGCYVTDAARFEYSGSYSCENCDPPPCYTSSDGTYTFLTPAQASPDQLVDAYGDPVYAIINSYYQNAVQSSVNYDAYRKQLSLVKKLRRACGARCRRIK